VICLLLLSGLVQQNENEEESEMGYSVKILLDSINSSGDRLTTFELTYPRFIHSEFMTHRMFSRNSASSRAIPIEKMIERVESDPVIPVYWGKNQKGMQAIEELEGDFRDASISRWLRARDQAIIDARALIHYGVHKQIVNRLLEPWMWITVICSATMYENFFKLRCHPDAQPEIQKLAYMMRDEYRTSTPNPMYDGECHLPLLPDLKELIVGFLGTNEAIPATSGRFPSCYLRKISVGRCARVSYLTHHGTRDPQADIELHDRLLSSGHWSPFEHVAYAAPGEISGNFHGWVQYRKQFEGESGI
jgi:thymidylate synthase ThyX